jgi:hypothetical protein
MGCSGMRPYETYPSRVSEFVGDTDSRSSNAAAIAIKMVGRNTEKADECHETANKPELFPLGRHQPLITEP